MTITNAVQAATHVAAARIESARAGASVGSRDRSTRRSNGAPWVTALLVAAETEAIAFLDGIEIGKPSGRLGRVRRARQLCDDPLQILGGFCAVAEQPVAAREAAEELAARMRRRLHPRRALQLIDPLPV